jgi:hypothetical protein
VERLAARHAADESRVYYLDGEVGAMAAEVARLDKQLRAARRVTLADADGHPDDAALVRQLEAAAKEVDSSLLECAALRLKRALAERDRLRALAEAALRLCRWCDGNGEHTLWCPDTGRERTRPCPACGPIRRGLDAPAEAPAGGPEDPGEGCDA